MRSLAASFISFHESYSHFFVTTTRTVSTQAFHYLSGLVQSVRKNVERMTEVVPDSDYQSLQHFVTHSPWEYRPVIDKVAKDADSLFGGDQDTGLLQDETSFPKAGKKSVAVNRQWCGTLGKVDNCQVGVFSSLVRGSSAALVDCRLYVPKEWTDDTDRCRKAGIPKDIVFKSKSQLALDSIQHLRSLGIRFSWVGIDGGYGKEPHFLSTLDDLGELFVADVHKDQPIYLEDPAPYVPERTSSKGRTPTRRKANSAATEVQAWAAAQPEEAWQRITTRNSTKGILQVDILVKRVWVWNKEESSARHWSLIVRREVDSRETIKYSLSNAPEGTSAERLAFMQGQRYFVERAFQDAKGTAGMDHYQVRSWQSWHHHMALVMMSTLFMLQTRLKEKESTPLLSCQDVATLLAKFLPRRDTDIEEVFRQMEVRHRQRQASIDFAYAKQNRKLQALLM
ncbi:MAG: IS701 family transposase [Desulfuromonadaceae bacterium]